MKDYNIKINNVEYKVTGMGDVMSTPPSARGFSLRIFEKGTGKYATVYKGKEDNGYAFIIYNDDVTELILKGKIGDDHNVDVYSSSEALRNIKKEKYNDQDNMVFLRQTCLSGRTWPVKLQNKQYYFVAIWNATITPQQYKSLKTYLSKFPSDATYIQMGRLSSESSSQFTLVNDFTPKISSNSTLTNKEKEFLKTAHMRTPELPAGYAKALKKLQGMTENTATYDEYAKIAKKVIEKLKRIQSVGGKSKANVKDIVTKSVVDSILFGLGSRYPEITKQLENLSDSAFTWQDLVKFHGKKIDMHNWDDTSVTEQLNEGSSSGGINSPTYGQNSGKSSGTKSSGTSSSTGSTPAGTTPAAGTGGSTGPKSQSFKESIPGTEEESYNLGKYKSDNSKFGANHMAKKMSRSQLKEMLRNEILSKNQEDLSEGWKDLAASAAIGLSSMGGAYAANKTPDAKIVQTAKIPAGLNNFLNALHQVESSGRTGHIVGDKGKALGPFQIHKSYWQDVKNIVGGNYEDVEDLKYAKKVVLAYLNKYGRKAFQQGDWETLARIHNGGPNGANNSNTNGYWQKVKHHLK